jgi:DNA-binding transcriptional ArsR family regulator
MEATMSTELDADGQPAEGETVGVLSYQQWAEEYLLGISTDRERGATADEVERLRMVVWHPPDSPEYPPTEFSPEELAWLEAAEPDVDECLRRRPDVLAAIESWSRAPYQPLLYVESLAELSGGAETFDPIISHLAYRGLKTLVVGLSKAGKSWTTWAKCAEAVRAGRRVLYLSEEPRATVVDKVRTFGLEDAYGKSFFVSRRQHNAVRLLPWAEVVDRLAKDVEEQRIDLAVVDTVRPWIALAGDESNSADAVGKAIDALSPVCEAGAAVMVLHQSPWSGKRARNSTEFHAATDLIFHVEGEGNGPRTIKYLGGRVEDVPDLQTFRWAGGQGEDLGRMRHDTAERVDEVLRVLESAGESLTAQELADQTDYSLRSVQRWLGELERTGKVIRTEGEHKLEGREPDRWTRAGALWEMTVGDIQLLSQGSF